MRAYVRFFNNDIDINSFDDWNAVLTSFSHSPALAKTEYTDIPAGNGSIDTSAALTGGIPVFDDRTLTYKFYIPISKNQWNSWEIEFRGRLDGRLVKIVESSSLNFYWTGRCYIGELTSVGAGTEFTITCQVEPLRISTELSKYSTPNALGTGESAIFHVSKQGYNSGYLNLMLLESEYGNASVTVIYKGKNYSYNIEAVGDTICIDGFVFVCDGTFNVDEIEIRVNSRGAVQLELQIQRGYL